MNNTLSEMAERNPERGTAIRLSVITPVYCEKDNLPILYQRLRESLDLPGLEWEWIAVDDHSLDGSFDVLTRLAGQDRRVRALRLARNSGSHTALACGLDYASGDCAVVMAEDMQDPPETIRAMLERWSAGAQVVWAVRAHREGESKGTLTFSNFYYWIMRRLVGIREMPESGADAFLVDRRVVAALRQFRETNVSLFALLTWMGFRQERITYVKKARLHGRSRWTLAKKLKLMVDSITSFTYLPIRVMSVVGAVVASLGFLWALVTLVRGLYGIPVQGWASLMVVVLSLGGVQMLMMGVLGEYLWRALDESRRRPRYLVEDMTGDWLRSTEKEEG